MRQVRRLTRVAVSCEMFQDLTKLVHQFRLFAPSHCFH
ncbi:hypothetical protein BMAPRL20_0802 [Burkholderia mallei PRL-20]|nr:hypothetical protein BMAJHU_F0288 [Burkholderia mallei JHU]EDO90805.1 hypothetical protein BURPSPAST_W0811 [Burkholderia pseudomallei Pasteur 52237]EEC31451.1 hypothetical protein BUC_5011 [Burkholderia pseudomallei 576]EEH28843.1 hypothetical protein BUH_5142 [Burkholderia pseudomallei Pakistan 9]EEP83660.1 hypothetical protein BMAGB8_A0918 [Burkholderia mallei GB8 horse 4]EES20870.1 hypothetical protein BURPS1106B_1142 [Burkholderia pseudomallei 1106b]EES42544.1 hypothetical protein BMAP